MTLCERQVKITKSEGATKKKHRQDTQGTLSAALTHSPALRLWGKLLVKCKRETKKGAMVSQLMQRVSSIQVKAPHLG